MGAQDEKRRQLINAFDFIRAESTEIIVKAARNDIDTQDIEDAAEEIISILTRIQNPKP